MYALLEYKLTKEEGYNKTFSLVKLIEYSDKIDKFTPLISSIKDFDCNGSIDTSRLYRKHKKILLNLDKLEKDFPGSMMRIRKLIRESRLDDLIKE